MGTGLTQICFWIATVLIFWDSIPSIFCVHVNHYDLSVLLMSKMAFQERSLDRGWVGGVHSIQFLCVDFWNCYNSSKPLILPVIIKTMASRTSSKGNIDIELYQPPWPQP